VGGSPETTAGQLLSAVLMVVGFLLLAVTTAAVASLFVSEDEAPQDARDREFEREALDELRTLNSRLERLERRLDADA
jgi:CHASE1-domain containing sensor protein